MRYVQKLIDSVQKATTKGGCFVNTKGEGGNGYHPKIHGHSYCKERFFFSFFHETKPGDHELIVGSSRPGQAARSKSANGY